MSKTLIKYWTNFAKSAGSPNSQVEQNKNVQLIPTYSEMTNINKFCDCGLYAAGVGGSESQGTRRGKRFDIGYKDAPRDKIVLDVHIVYFLSMLRI